MVGYTPQVSAAVWVGTGFRKPIYNADGSPLYGADLPGKTWKLFMDTYLKGKKHEKLPTKQQIAANGFAPKPDADLHAVVEQQVVLERAEADVQHHRPGSPSSPSSRPATAHADADPDDATTPTPTATSTCGGVLKPPCKP